MNIDEVLIERGQVYGSYESGKKFEKDVLIGMNLLHQIAHNHDMPMIYNVMVMDILKKLSRLAVSPADVDTIRDIEGYARLYRETLPGGNDNAKEQ